MKCCQSHKSEVREWALGSTVYQPQGERGVGQGGSDSVSNYAGLKREMNGMVRGKHD